MTAIAEDTAGTARPRRTRRRLAALALAAAVLSGGAAVSLPATHAQAMPRQQMCWYKGYFYQDGAWWYGWFSEPC